MKPIAFASLVTVACHCSAAEVTAVRESKQIIVRSGDKEILRYQAEPGELPRPEIPTAYVRGGYIQSIHTPSGRLITDDFPSNHLHHHGVWSPWTKTEFEGRHPDFWNMGAGTGTVEFVAADKLWQKDGAAGFSVNHRFIDLTAQPAKAALLESWDIKVSSEDGVYQIDFTSTQKCASASPLKLPEYHYGGFGFRGNAAWNDKENCRFLGADGVTDRNKLNTLRERWVWVGGKVDGATCGVTILCHPSNFRFPQPVRANPTEPFFCYAPQQLGEMEITPGKDYVARYRLIVADGEPDAGKAEQWWKAYAQP